MKRKWRGPNAARLISFSEQMESSGEWSTVANSGVMMMQSGSWSGKVSHVSRQNMLGIVLHVTTEAFGNMLGKGMILSNYLINAKGHCGWDSKVICFSSMVLGGHLPFLLAPQTQDQHGLLESVRGCIGIDVHR